ncbi:SDR family oxidoreductase [Frankia sp. Mgl5]|uniref:type I polyketide synthase n=1 Tax=Frankia sp. Mgl5 TaxID=2933793 RepID=UPI00200D9725|nr:type I polyketide synthase [Frankia sp. Mgl5]MCK9931889.1 SDR family oxidoreductase [Frankia sp. Mgl5]
MTTITAARTSPQVPVAVVGVGAIMPGSTDAPGFWDSILRGEDLITDVPRSHWLPEDYFDPDPSVLDKTYVRRGSFLPLVDFDPTEFGIPPSIIPATDTAQLFALKVADQTLRDALGDRYEQADRGRFGIILGSGNLELLSEIYIRLGRPMWYRSLRDLGFSHPDADHICDYMMKDYPRWQEATLPGGLGNIVAGRVANRLDLHGVNYTVDAACASSLAAVSAAVNELALGRADMIISGGVDALNNPCTFVSFCRTPALSPTQDCRPFAADADGTLLGEGVAMVALKRLADAQRDGDRIYAVIRGIGASSDGHGSAIYAPTPGGQIRALHASYLDAGYSPATVELLEAHGTGTVVGDRTEVTALTEVFGDARRGDHRWCALGSVKSQVGHTKSAAGAAGLLKAVLALHHHALPPTIKVTEPNPDLGLETSPFYLNTVGRPWAEPADHPRRASVSSFGFGGINFHIALEEAPHSPAPVMAGSPPAAGALTRSVATGSVSTGSVSTGAALNGAGPVEAAGPAAAGSELVLFSGATAQEILDALRSVDLPDEDDRSLDSGRTAALAWASQHRFDPGQPVRLAVAAAGTRQLAARLDQAAALVARRPDESFTNPVGVHYQVDAGRPADDAGDRLAFLFPGQGSQYLGMGRDLALRHPAARRVWDRFGVLRLGDGAAAGGAAAGGTVADMVFPPPVFSEAEQAAQRDALTASEWAQPALAVHELALLAALTDVGVRPRAAAGHSFGELAALCAAGVLDATSLVALARRRGELVRDAAATAPGGMLAAVATPTEVTAALGAPGAEPGAGEAAQGELGRDVWMTNLNAPRQVVLSGTADGVVAAARRLAAAGITTRRLDTAAGFHSPLLDGARDPLRRFVDDLEIRAPRFGVYAGADGRPYPSDPWAVRERIIDQLTTPVRFVDQIEAMYADGIRTFVEVGPGGTLTGLVDQILDGREHAATSLERHGQDGDATLMSALGRLAVLGLDLDLDRLWAARGAPERREPVMTVKIDGSNYGRYYPSPELLATPAVQETSGDARSSNGFVWNEPGTEPPNVRSNGHVTSAAPAPATEPAPPTVETGLAAETGPTGVHPEADARAGAGVDPGAVNGADTAGRSAAGGGAEVAEAMAPPDGDTPGVMSAAPFPSPAPAPESAPPPPPALGPGPTPGPTSALGSAAPPALAAGPGEQPPLRLAPGWPEAVEQTHRQTAAAHTAYQQLMTEAHLEFLRVTGAVCSWLAGAPPTDGPHSQPRVVDGVSFGPAESSAPHTVAPPSAAPRGPSTAAAFAVTAPPPTPAPPPMPTPPPAPATPAPAETGGWATAVPPTPTAGGPAPTVPAEPALATPAPTGGPAPAEPAGAAPTAPATGPGPAAEPEGGPAPAGMTPEEVTDLLFDVVSERTGYPKEVLNIDMELEGDLGIDSLKKVEILSALRQQVGDVAVDVSETDAIAELASLRTLGEVVELIRQRLGSPGSGDTPGADPESPADPEPPGTGPASPGADPGSPGAGPDSSGAGPELATAAPGTAGGAPFRLSRFVAGLEKAPAPGLAMRGLRGRPLTVVDGGSGVGAALVDELTRAGVAAELAVGRRPAAVLTRDRGGVVLLGGLAGPDTAATDGSPTGAMLEVQRDAFNWARAVAGSGLTEDADPGGRSSAVFVTVQDTGGDLGLGGARGDRAWLGGLAALAATAAAEWPSVAVKALDCERAGRSPAAVAAVVVAELLRGGDTPVVALRGDGTRLVPVVLPADAARPAGGAGPRTGSATASRPADAARTELEIGPETVITVTGGARGVTAAGVVELARRHRPRLVLLGRTALADEPPGLAGARDERALVRELARVSGTAGGPARLRARAREILAVREVRATLAALAEIGAPVRYHCLDVRDAGAVAAAFDEVRREWGPVHGLVHGAGALADRLIVDKTDDDFAQVFDTKVGGLRVLLEELAGDPLRLLCLFTSVAGWFGNPGQSDYAMANATLDHVASAYQAAHPDCLVRSIAWGPWAGGMVGSLLAEAFTRRGIPPIPLPRGAQAFADELTGAPDGAPATAAGSTRVMIASCDASVIGGAGRGPAAGVLGELAVHAGAQPWLVDHSPAGTAVLPLAMALDWLARGALALSPAVAGGVTLRDLRVLRKIALPELARGGHRFAVVAAPGRQPGETLLRVDGEGGVPHYSARFGPDQSPPVSAGRWPTPAGLVDHPEESARHRDRIYGQGALFHGPRFHAITWLMGMSPDGAEGTVVGVDELAWGGDGWYFDVAALDGGMQLAGLWAWRALGGAIPIAVRECRIHRPGLLREPARGVVHARGIDGVHTHCDVAVLDGDGAPRIELLGVELVLRPDRMSRSR